MHAPPVVLAQQLQDVDLAQQRQQAAGVKQLSKRLDIAGCRGGG